jgi:hypothetical protein
MVGQTTFFLDRQAQARPLLAIRIGTQPHLAIRHSFAHLIFLHLLIFLTDKIFHKLAYFTITRVRPESAADPAKEPLPMDIAFYQTNS